MDEALIQEQERQLQKTGRYYRHVFWLCVPLLCMACYFYGARPLLLCGVALLTGNLCDRLVALLRHRVYTNKDLSNVSFSLIIALLMPAPVDSDVLVVAVLAGVLIGKEVFGGYGSYPFNPAAVGYAVAAVSWPEQVVRYPQPYTPLPLWNASAVPVSSTIEDTLRSGGILNLNSLAIALGEFAAPMGTGAALVILACLLSRLVPLRDEEPSPAQLQKKLLPRAILYAASAAVVYLAAYPILNLVFGTGLLNLGIYLPMLVVEPLLTYRFGRVQETVHKAVSKGVRITVGYALLLLVIGMVREWLSLGTVFGAPVGRWALLPLAKMPAGGFIVLGILCAIWRAAAAKRREFLKKEAQDTLTVHYQKEVDREP